MNYELKQGQAVFKGTLIEFSKVQGTSKKTNKDFDFVKFNVDVEMVDKDGRIYTRLCEFIADPIVAGGQTFDKYKPVLMIFEITSPVTAPRLVKVIKEN